MFPRICLVPQVTTSRTKLIEHIMIVCEVGNIDLNKEWIKKILKKINEAHYFVGLIFIERTSFYLLLHELIHHMSAFLRGYTQSKIWYNLDYLIDGLDIFLFRK